MGAASEDDPPPPRCGAAWRGTAWHSMGWHHGLWASPLNHAFRQTPASSHSSTKLVTPSSDTPCPHVERPIGLIGKRDGAMVQGGARGSNCLRWGYGCATAAPHCRRHQR
jgi:hypothetical protein